MRRDAYQHYRNQQVQTASPAELVGMLYDAALKAVRAAGEALDDGRPADVHERLVKAQDILTELRCALNFDAGGDLARNLDGLYGYAIGLLVEANVSRSTTKLDDVVAVLAPLRDAWKQVNTVVVDDHAIAAGVGIR